MSDIQIYFNLVDSILSLSSSCYSAYYYAPLIKNIIYFCIDISLT